MNYTDCCKQLKVQNVFIFSVDSPDDVMKKYVNKVKKIPDEVPVKIGVLLTSPVFPSRNT